MKIKKVMFSSNGLENNVIVYVEDDKYFTIGKDILQQAFGTVQDAVGKYVESMDPLTLIEQPAITL